MRYIDEENLEIQNIALTIVQSIAAIYQEPPDWVAVSADDIPLVNVSFYEAATTELAQSHFRILGNAENAASTRRTPAGRTIARFLVSDDGTTLAVITFVRAAVPGASVVADVSFASEIGDEIVITSNGKGRIDRVRPAGVRLVEVDEPSFTAIAKTHKDRVKRLRSRNGDAGACVYHRLVDAIGAMSRLHARTAEHRRSIGWIEEKELIAMFKRRLPAEIIAKLAEAVRELTREKKPVAVKTDSREFVTAGP